MGNIIAALLVGGFATMVLVLPYGVYLALLAAPFGASLLAMVVAVGSLVLKSLMPAAPRFKKGVAEPDRQKR